MTKKNAQEAATFLQQKGGVKPVVGIVLGTGLNALVHELENALSIPYREIPFFAEAGVRFHKGELLFGKLGKTPVVVMQGRFHLYEGYSYEQITFPIRVMAELGIEKLLISNAAGAINLNFKKAELMLIEDQLHLQPGSPLANKTAGEWGNTFVDMSEPYDKEMRKQLQSMAQDLQIGLQRGVYVSVIGPQLETKAEYKYLGVIGADAVGMSTTAEVIVANQMGIPVAGISVLTDECDPENLKPVDIPEILATAAEAEKKLVPLVTRFVQSLN